MSITDYQKDCFANYKKSIEYPLDYTYLRGNPINVLVPIETTLNKAMIVGAYPSAKFYTLNHVSGTPMTDNDSPFSNESYFDGSRVRTIPSGQELNEVILDSIGIQRSECWITDLVKVFLFKEGHINRYRELQKTDIRENRTLFDKFALLSLPWLDREINICNPGIIILLGLEVTKIFFNITNKQAYGYLDGKIRQKEISGIDRNIICLPHPGILMKKTLKNPWPAKFKEVISINAKKEIQEIRKGW